jgi:hypothetical protein
MLLSKSQLLLPFLSLVRNMMITMCAWALEFVGVMKLSIKFELSRTIEFIASFHSELRRNVKCTTCPSQETLFRGTLLHEAGSYLHL